MFHQKKFCLISDFSSRSFCHQRFYDTTLGSLDRGGYPERDGGEEGEEGLVLEYSSSWIKYKI